LQHFSKYIQQKRTLTMNIEIIAKDEDRRLPKAG
jgi:hypothetical protein